MIRKRQKIDRKQTIIEKLMCIFMWFCLDFWWFLFFFNFNFFCGRTIFFSINSLGNLILIFHSYLLFLRSWGFLVCCTSHITSSRDWLRLINWFLDKIKNDSHTCGHKSNNRIVWIHNVNLYFTSFWGDHKLWSIVFADNFVLWHIFCS